jgi:hypothetical protein
MLRAGQPRNCVQILAGPGDFSLLHSIQTGSGADLPTIQWVLGALAPGVKQLGHEADPSPVLTSIFCRSYE